ncbi:MAG: RNA-binding transcriptional accessory protein, partial [Planctomycetes bacterium]|nr:RNA-binding transcriptional accessory protein [Planctomycetota bacterium]
MSEVQSVDFPRLAAELGFKPEQVANTVALLDEENTVPFITRYRKERTGNLDEEQIRAIQKKVGTLRQLAERSQTVLRLIESQGKLTPELRQAIKQAQTLKRLDDLYLPFRPKRTSRAAQARDRGLEPLANAIWNGDKRLPDLALVAARFVNPEKGLETVDAVLQGAADILSERIAEIADIRTRCRRIAQSTGRLTVSATKSGKAAEKEYRNYFDYSEAVEAIPPHRALAINRGEKEGVLRVKLDWDEARANTATVIYLQIGSHPFVEFVTRCVADAISRLIAPSLEREIRRELTEQAEAQAISVFARNLRNLLLQSPLHGARVFAIDPGFRTGCKIAVLDEYGCCQATDVVYVSGSKEKRAATLEKLHGLLTEHNCGLIALGNGTACRETEELISELIADKMPDLRYLIVNEAGASVYSTSPVAREEFPDFDATVRGTISIGRRLLDPLSELVKIEPQHIGVGMYQHDVGSKRLKNALDDVVESCVNYVGVDLNTASASLLRYVSGLNQLIARRVVEHRETNGRFTNRGQLRDVPGIGESTYTQAAGFLKIIGGDEPLDSTWIHPESYDAARELLSRMTVVPEQLLGNREAADELRQRCSELKPEEIAEELSVGLPTFHDIVDGLTRPGRDPRSDLPGPVFRQGVLKLDDLHADMEFE